MTRQISFIPLTFTASPNTTATISCPFPVKTLHIKSGGYQAGTNGTTRYVALTSDLTNNSPLGIFNQDTTYSSGTISDVEYKFRTPQVINGNYTFTLLTMAGILASTSNAGAATDSIGLIIEFNDEEEMS